MWPQKDTAKHTAAVLIIGNEILSGRTQDVNLGFIAQELSKLGIPVMEASIVPDDQEVIIANVNRMRKEYTYVFTTGGLGPTHDDITIASIAKACGVGLYRDEAAVEMIKKYYKEADGGIDEDVAFKMADLPKGSRVIVNEVSGAPGFKIENVFVFAGVPEIVRSMFNYSKIYLKGTDQFVSRAMQVMAGESVITDFFGKLQEKYPDLSLGSYPSRNRGKWYATLVIRGQKLTKVNQAFKELDAGLVAHGIEHFELGSEK